MPESTVTETVFLFHMNEISKTLETIESTVKLQNSRVYKLEEKIALNDQKAAITKDSKARWFAAIGIIVGLSEAALRFFSH